MPLLPRSVVVKNTFIEQKDEDRHDQRMHALGENTCIARFSADSDKSVDWCSDDGLSQASTPNVCDRMRSMASEADTSAPSMCDRTKSPTGAGGTFTMRTPTFPLGHIEPSTNVIAPITRCGQQDVSSFPVPGRRIWLNIPVEVPYYNDCSSEDFSFTVTSSIADRDSGCTSFRVKVNFNKSREALPARVEDSGTCMGSPRSRRVCHHWRTKGWCLYKESCKFQHPARKRGVGLNKGA